MESNIYDIMKEYLRTYTGEDRVSNQRINMVGQLEYRLDDNSNSQIVSVDPGELHRGGIEWINDNRREFLPYVIKNIMSTAKHPRGLKAFLLEVKDAHSMYDMMNQMMEIYDVEPQELISILGGKYRAPSLFSFLRDHKPRITEKSISLLLTCAVQSLTKDQLTGIANEFQAHVISMNSPTIEPLEKRDDIVDMDDDDSELEDDDAPEECEEPEDYPPDY